MITVTYRFKNDRPSIPPSKFMCDKIEQYDMFMRTYGRTIIVETDSTKRYDSPVAMPMPMPWWCEPYAEEIHAFQATYSVGKREGNED